MGLQSPTIGMRARFKKDGLRKVGIDCMFVVGHQSKSHIRKLDNNDLIYKPSLTLIKMRLFGNKLKKKSLRTLPLDTKRIISYNG